MSETHDLFVSYRRKNEANVEALVAALQEKGLRVWLDRNEIADAASIQRSIDQGLSGSRALLARYTVDYPKSRACQWELTASLIAAGAKKAPVGRLLVVNPEKNTSHIEPISVRDLQHFYFDGDYQTPAPKDRRCHPPNQRHAGRPAPVNALRPGIVDSHKFADGVLRVLRCMN